MTDDEALQMGRKAVEDARKRVGDSPEQVLEELEARAVEDPQVREAIGVAGLLWLQSQQETKH